jgi:hypothetical protein
MRKYLISEKGQFYKANLHTHTTVSDGKLTPEQVKKLYMDKGYSAVAFTDHDALVCHNDLTDDKFIALNGYEMEFDNFIDGEKPYHRSKTCHICLVALSPNTTKQVCFHRTKYLHRNNNLDINTLDFDKNMPDYERVYSNECVNNVIKQAVDAGYFVTYNHPTWSGESYPDYMGYEHMHAMEIYNNECIFTGNEEFNSRVYDDMLRGGKTLFCTATDDMHKELTAGGGFVMIKADKLDYESLTSNLIKGNFYSSTGAEIKELYVEDGYIYVTTSPAKMISMTMGIMRVEKELGIDEPITQAKFKIMPNANYVRITVTGVDDKKAYTNAYFIKDLL